MASSSLRAARPFLLVLVAALAVVAAGAAQTQGPPHSLHSVQGHWTAWNPPSEFPQGAQVYVIEKGDTLWDLAQRNYGDPYLWPQLWERNRYIQDAHWIYPGDPLVLGIEATPIEQVATAPSPEASAEGEAEPSGEDRGGLHLEHFAAAPAPLGSESDVHCSGFIGALDEPLPLAIAASEYENLTPQLQQAVGPRVRGMYGRVDTVKYDLSTGDIVYLNGGSRQGLFPGEVYMVIAPAEKVVHPVTGQVVGRHYQYHGRVRVLSVQQDTAIGEIIYTCAPVLVGDGLRVFEEEPVPLGRRGMMRAVNDPVSAESLAQAPVILESVDSQVSLGQDHMVFIDRGADSVAPGDLFTIYRENSPGMPPVVIGELAVLTVSDRAALARIVESRYTVYVGDRLSPKEQ
jgi:LysM domain